MSHVFSADEILEMAEQIERNGAKFYRDSAENVDDAIERKFLLQLAGMEDHHLKTFTAMRAQLSGKEHESPAFDPDQEAGMYLKSLADAKVFFEKDMDSSSLEEIYKTAILAEKDSIAFYIGMKDLVPEYLGKDKLDAIIKEEMQHIKTLNQKLIVLKK
ncbi:MAG: ferritin family protein [Candidatus Aminicenantes bacterium]|nr:ferritin family protein [Candidatus Aminicenantes bacterium]